MKKTILSLNCGSSSLKFNIFNINDDMTVSPILNGIAEEIGNIRRSSMRFSHNGDKTKYPISLETHEDALSEMFEVFTRNGVQKESICAVGHRIVHGGPIYTKSTLINEEVKEQIKSLFSVAPLHNPQNYIGVEVTEKLLPGVPNVAVFDTAFHGTMGCEAFRYAIPQKWYEQFLIRRYGFHGTSHLYVSKRAAVLCKTPYDEFTCVTAHLGNGSSITKVENGKSRDTSMGFTPLEGVIMGTRCGDLDPAIIAHVANLYVADGMDKADAYDKTTHMLNKDCGLKGLAGTNLMQDIRAKALEGDEESLHIVDIYCYRIAKYIGEYACTTDNLKAIVFTAGVGENEWFVRQRVLEMLKAFAFEIDHEANKIRGEETIIGKGKFAGNEVCAMVIPTDEELIIAYDALTIGYLGKQAPTVYPFEKA